jgi:hypothetical protein
LSHDSHIVALIFRKRQHRERKCKESFHVEQCQTFTKRIAKNFFRAPTCTAARFQKKIVLYGTRPFWKKQNDKFLAPARALLNDARIMTPWLLFFRQTLRYDARTSAFPYAAR